MTARAIEVVRGVLSAEAIVLLGCPLFLQPSWTPELVDMPFVQELVWEGLARWRDEAAGVIEPTAAGRCVAAVLAEAGVTGEGRRTLAALSDELEAFTGVPLATLRSARQDAVASRGRALLAFLACEELNKSNSVIAAWLKRDASSVPEMRRRGAALIAAEPEVAAVAAGVRAWLAGADA